MKTIIKQFSLINKINPKIYYLIALFCLSCVSYAQESLPDLFVDDAVLLPQPGSRILMITIGNNGSAFPEEKVMIEVSFQNVNGVLGKSKAPGRMVIPYDKLAPGILYEVQWKDPLPAESFVLNVRIDPQHRIKEFDKKNNIYRKDFSSQEIPALASERLCNMTFGKFYVVPYYGNKVILRMHILNLGTSSPEKDFQVVLTWEPSSPGDKNSWNLKARNHLPGSEVIISSGQITLPKANSITFKAVLDPDGRLKETDEQDNEKTLVHPITP
jgi:hypothetical protein